MNSRRRIIIYALSVLALIFLGSGIFILKRPATDKLLVAFLSVGQGDAVLIRTADEKDVLIDAGPDRSVLARLAQILPWYDRELDMIVLTHNHLDHYAGIIALLEKYKVGQVVVSAVSEPLPQELALALAEHKVAYQKIEAGAEVKLDERVSLRALWPKSGAVITEMNDRSLVMELVSGQVKFLLGGDSGIAVEDELMKNNLVREVDVFKLSHHGSDTANGQAFLELLSPRWVVVQAGSGNSFGHPNRRILKRAERVGARVLRNDVDGTVVFESDGVALNYRLIK